MDRTNLAELQQILIASRPIAYILASQENLLLLLPRRPRQEWPDTTNRLAVLDCVLLQKRWRLGWVFEDGRPLIISIRS